MNRIEHGLSYQPQILLKQRSPYYMTYIEGTITNPHTNKNTLSIHKFIVDTGAAITILNNRFGSLFKDTDTPIIDHVNIHYGGGVIKDPLPVYLVRLKIKGVEFEIPAAYDSKMTLTSLLGHYGFLNSLEHFGVSKSRKKLTLIK